ncbi:MAG: MerR family transcriptional regulator [Alphaproteobacteria bacterium]|nr:MerR family transcriptional regulator [Alphaproteobacteria bacterium]
MADTAGASRRSGDKSAQAFRTISEVATALDVPQHVLRFWESKFSQVRPLKRGGGRRYYRPDDVDLLQNIRNLLYDDGYTIKGVQKLLRDGALKPKRGSGKSPDSDKASAAATPKGAGSDTKLSAAQRQELQGLLEELEQLKSMLKSALD